MTVPVPRHLPRAVRLALARYNAGAAGAVPRFLPRNVRTFLDAINDRLASPGPGDLPIVRGLPRAVRVAGAAADLELDVPAYPDGAIAYANFATGVYMLGGDAVTINDLFDSGTYDGAALVAGEGLVANDSIGSVDPVFTAGLFAAIEAGATVVLDFEMSGRGDVAFGISKFGFGDNIYAHGMSDPDWCEWIVADDNGGFSVYENPNQDGSSNPQPLADGAHKIAVSFSPTMAAAAFPGLPATYEHTGRTFTFNTAGLEIGASAVGAVTTLRAVTFYATMTAAELPALIA